MYTIIHHYKVSRYFCTISADYKTKRYQENVQDLHIVQAEVEENLLHKLKDLYFIEDFTLTPLELQVESDLLFKKVKKINSPQVIRQDISRDILSTGNHARNLT